MQGFQLEQFGEAPASLDTLQKLKTAEQGIGFIKNNKELSSNFTL